MLAKDDPTYQFQIIQRERRKIRRGHAAAGKVERLPGLYPAVLVLSAGGGESRQREDQE